MFNRTAPFWVPIPRYAPKHLPTPQAWLPTGHGFLPLFALSAATSFLRAAIFS